MGDLIIKPADEGHLKLQNDAGTTILEMVDDESKLRLAQNNISASDGTTAITTSSANVTLAGTSNNIGTATGTFNGTLDSSATFPDGHVIGVYSDNYTRSSALDILNGTTLWSELDVSVPATSTANKLVVQVHIPGVSDKDTTSRHLAGAGLKYSTDSWSSSATLGASEYILAPGGFDSNAGQVRESAVYQTYTAVPTSSAFRIRTYLNASGDIEIFAQGTGEASMIVWLIKGS